MNTPEEVLDALLADYDECALAQRSTVGKMLFTSIRACIEGLSTDFLAHSQSGNKDTFFNREYVANWLLEKAQLLPSGGEDG